MKLRKGNEKVEAQITTTQKRQLKVIAAARGVTMAQVVEQACWNEIDRCLHAGDKGLPGGDSLEALLKRSGRGNK